MRGRFLELTSIDLQKRFVGPCAVLVDDERQVAVRPGDLAATLLLFEEYVLESCKLLEFGQLVSVFGFDSVLELVKSRSIKVKCDANLIGVLGDTDKLVSEGKWREFDFTYIRAADHNEYVSSCLSDIPTSPHLNRKQRSKLKQAIAVRIDKEAGSPPELNSPELKAVRNFLNEASSNLPNVKRSCVLELKERHGIVTDPGSFSLTIHRPRADRDLLGAETNLNQIFNISEGQTHDVIKYGLLRMSGINERFGVMERYSALTGLNHSDLPVFEGRYEFLASEYDPTKDVALLNRVIGIQGFPDFHSLADEGRLKLDRVLELRETKECHEFRAWLKTIDKATDKEIEDQIESLRSTVGNFLGSTKGKAIRFLVSSGVGLIPSVGLVASAIDSFLLEKLFPVSGPISFVNKLIPSMFDLGEKRQRNPSNNRIFTSS